MVSAAKQRELVPPYRAEGPKGGMPIADFIEELSLVLIGTNRALRNDLNNMQFHCERYAADCKRRKIKLNEVRKNTSGQTIKVAKDSEDWAELKNQAATILRLLDAARWVKSKFSDSVVVLANPTTSSLSMAGNTQCTHDLVVRTHGGQLLAFEASDNISTGARSKWEKSKNILQNCTGSHHNFVVMSTEMYGHVLRSKPVAVEFCHTREETGTMIVEIRKSP